MHGLKIEGTAFTKAYMAKLRATHDYMWVLSSDSKSSGKAQLQAHKYTCNRTVTSLSAQNKISVATYVLQFLRHQGLEYVFGMPGSGNDELILSISEVPGMKFILTKHEQNGAYMATAYSMLSGRAAIATSTSGPGAWNLLAGSDVAYANSIPLFLITGENLVQGLGTGGIQDSSGWGPRTLSQQKAYQGSTKLGMYIETPFKVHDAMKRAYVAMVTGRKGPVQLQIPVDIQRAQIDADVPTDIPDIYSQRIRGDPEAIKKSALMLHQAQRPAILAGWGVIESRAASELLELAELLSAGVAFTLRGKGAIPELHDLSLGVAGSMGHDTANQYLIDSNVDILLALGVSFSQFTTSGWRKNFGGKKIIQVDMDPEEIGKNYPSKTIGIVSDVKMALLDIMSELKKLGETDESRESTNRKAISRLKKDLRFYEEPGMFSEAIPMNPQRVLKELRGAIPTDAIVFTDCGGNLIWTERYFPILAPGTFFCDGLTHMGWSGPAVIGAKIARPDKIVTTILGDGSFAMSCQDVRTAVTNDIPVIWCILDDSALGVIRQRQLAMQRDLKKYVRLELDNGDFLKFAESQGAMAERVEAPGKIKGAIEHAIQSNRPYVIDLIIDRDIPHPKMVALGQIVKPD